MKVNRRLTMILTLFMVFALVLSGCGGGGEIQPPEEEQGGAAGEGEIEAGDTAEERKVAVFIFTQEFDTLNPYYTNMWFSQITQAIWLAWAWDFDENNEPRPVLVAEIPSVENGGLAEDGKVLTMRLRDDITWSDGTPITSADFVFTHEMIMDPANTVASTFPNDQIETIEAPDAQTVVITFSEPFVPWAATLWHGLLPKHILEPVFESEGTIDSANWNLNPVVGCGPFVFTEWESGSFARFVANENYWAGRPALDEVFIRFVPDDAAQINALLAGEGDLGTFFAYSDVPELEAVGINIYAVQSGYNEGWYMYIAEDGHPALMDVRVRQAIAMGFDRPTLVEDLLLGLTQPAVTYWDNTPFANPELEPWPYDPVRAEALLDQAGWVDTNGDGVRDKDGVELVLSYGTTTREVRQDTQAVAQQQLAGIGVELNLLNYDSDLFFAVDGPAALGELDIMEWSDTTDFPDPNITYWLISEIPTEDYPVGLNWQRVYDEELDALFQLQSTQADFTDRQETFWEISEQVYEKVYWLGIWQDPDLFGVNERLTGIKLSGVTPFFNIMEWDLVD